MLLYYQLASLQKLCLKETDQDQTKVTLKTTEGTENFMAKFFNAEIIRPESFHMLEQPTKSLLLQFADFAGFTSVLGRLLYCAVVEMHSINYHDLIL